MCFVLCFRFVSFKFQFFNFFVHFFWLRLFWFIDQTPVHIFVNFQGTESRSLWLVGDCVMSNPPLESRPRWSLLIISTWKRVKADDDFPASALNPLFVAIERHSLAQLYQLIQSSSGTAFLFVSFSLAPYRLQSFNDYPTYAASTQFQSDWMKKFTFGWHPVHYIIVSPHIGSGAAEFFFLVFVGSASAGWLAATTVQPSQE